MYRKKLLLRVVGFLLSLILTTSIYSVVIHPDFFHLTSEIAVEVILILAILLASIQCVFFLDIWSKNELLWNVGFFASTLSIIGIIVAFSIWIMDKLNYNMMPNG